MLISLSKYAALKDVQLGSLRQRIYKMGYKPWLIKMGNRLYIPDELQDIMNKDLAINPIKTKT